MLKLVFKEKSMSASPNWTKEELAVLAENYPILGKCEQLQKLFPTRTLQGICLKANRMGYKVLHNIRIGRTDEEYIKLLESTNFVALEPYAGSTTPILHVCGICDYEWRARPQQILKMGTKCPECDLVSRKLSKETVSNVLNIAGFEQLSEYTGALDSVTLKHNYCGHVWNTVYSYIQQGSGCPICNKGFGYAYSKNNLPETAFIYLYKIIVNNHTFLKIGVTTRDVKYRETELKSKIKNISYIALLHYSKDSGINILKKEKSILRKFTKYTYKEVFPGYTELLDKSNNIESIKEIMNENI